MRNKRNFLSKKDYLSIKKRTVFLGFLGNVSLFLLKILIGFVSNSLAVMSDAFNSLSDIVTSIILFVSILVGGKSADNEHPFGHYRSEPIGSLIVAVLTVVLGFEILRISVSRFITNSFPKFSQLALFLLIGTIIAKSLMYLYTKFSWNKTQSPAIFALAIDHRNDILISIFAIIGFLGSSFNLFFLDSLVAFFIGAWIIKVGISIGIKSIKYLIGETAEPELIKKISKAVLKISGVSSIQKIKAHYVGILLQVEVHIRVNRNISVYRSHTIETNARRIIERFKEVDRAFVHIDPIIKSRPH
ncbi:cation transporter [Candidatus Woesearchaeota archaeon]|nr:cation transporter [Candidatus Woesearchaeota archaeon]